MRNTKRRCGDPLAYYAAHYSALTRGQLKQCDRKLYECLRRQGLIERLPRARRVYTDPLADFFRHYGGSGLRRTEFQKRDPGLYQRLREDGLLDAAIPLPPVIRTPLPRPIRKGSRVFDCR